MTVTYGATLASAKAARDFISVREASGEPVATAAQVKRAEQLVSRDPSLRTRRTPIGIQLLALNIPLTRYERTLNRTREKDPVTLEPFVVRTGDEAEITADRTAIEAFVNASPHLGAMEAAEAIAQMHGYTNLAPMVKRVERFSDKMPAEKGYRIPGHIRAKMLCLSAIAIAIELCQARDIAEDEANAADTGEA